MFRVLSYFIALLLMVLAHVPACGETPTSEGVEFFEKRIRPILATHCYQCHSAAAVKTNKLKGGFALDTRAALLLGGESGAAIVSGDPKSSLLIDALKHEGLKMPPSEKLPADVVADFEKWISMGAPDPRDGVAAKGKTGMSLSEGRQLWSFIPPRISPPPRVKREDWSANEIDLHILAGLESQGLHPLNDAESRALVRRLSFDLLGLPPDFATVEAFAANPSPAALEQLVDGMLSSPHFGERWGRHWLDSARYADSNGRDRNILNFHAWRYRDYVIDAFNHDKPYDTFLQEQIAGDLLPVVSREDRDEKRIATGFLAMGAKAFEELKPEIFRMDIVDEQIELVGRSILGISVGCARCHDHKFDPIPTADYYALAGIFRSTQLLYGFGPKGNKANLHVHSDLYTVGPQAESLGPTAWEHVLKIQKLTLVQNQMSVDRYRVVRNESAAKLQLNQPDADRSKLEAEIARMAAEIKDWDSKVKVAKEELSAAYDAAPPQPGWCMGARDREKVEDSRIHIRGETTNLGESVPRGMLQVISLSPRVDDGSHSGRLELAHWLTHRENPLTARVYVNRVWQHLFGRGLVTTPDDFGVNGARPSHPALLDTLAVRFMESGWSTKQLIRRLVLSRTYRLSSRADGGALESFATLYEKDPDNVYFGRMKPRRLEAEVLRDALMHAAGTLIKERPAPDQSILARLNPYRDDEYRPFAPVVAPANIEHSHRSIYSPVIRGVLPEFFQLFDFASPERPVTQREESTVPAQSLFFMNNPWVMSQARTLARKLLAEAMLDERGRITSLYETALGRRPTTAEIDRARIYVSSAPQLKSSTPAKSIPTSDELREEAWTNLCQTIFASAEFRYVK